MSHTAEKMAGYYAEEEDSSFRDVTPGWRRNLTMKRGEISRITLVPTVGAEIRRTRPASILNDDSAECSELRKHVHRSTTGPSGKNTRVEKRACYNPP